MALDRNFLPIPDLGAQQAAWTVALQSWVGRTHSLAGAGWTVQAIQPNAAWRDGVGVVVSRLEQAGRTAWVAANWRAVERLRDSLGLVLPGLAAPTPASVLDSALLCFAAASVIRAHAWQVEVQPSAQLGAAAAWVTLELVGGGTLGLGFDASWWPAATPPTPSIPSSSSPPGPAELARLRAWRLSTPISVCVASFTLARTDLDDGLAVGRVVVAPVDAEASLRLARGRVPVALRQIALGQFDGARVLGQTRPVETPLDAADVHVDVVIATRQVPVVELLALAPGQVFDVRTTQARAELRAGDQVLARGQLIWVDGAFAVQIDEVVAPPG